MTLKEDVKILMRLNCSIFLNLYIKAIWSYENPEAEIFEWQRMYCKKFHVYLKSHLENNSITANDNW